MNPTSSTCVGGEQGSPVFALDRLLHHDAAPRMRLKRERVHLIFTEERRDRFEHLEALLGRRFGPLDRLPVTVTARCAEAGAATGSLLGATGAWGCPVLAVFDSWGNVGVPLGLIRRLAQNPASEVIVTFGPNWFNRREQMEPDHLDLVFGGRARWEPADRESRPAERWRAWLATYRDALRRAGFRYQLQFEIVPHTGQPLFLVFGTGHEKGVEVMKEAMWEVDGNDGMSFRDPRTRGGQIPNQMTLWSGSGTPQDELLDLVTLRLEAGQVTIDELRGWLLTETARWRRPDAAKAIRQLLEDGKVTVSPSGRLTGASTVRLR
ncbi:MAG TPA: three-Cys-motif partner protein TcmP [Streptosporangiaceae bacterium]|nr:three-Cys-motif partner protein TcmP [Streptosporangiaceae bacterium]